MKQKFQEHSMTMKTFEYQLVSSGSGGVGCRVGFGCEMVGSGRARVFKKSVGSGPGAKSRTRAGH